MAAHALLVWLLGTENEKFILIHSRLRATAAPLTAMIDMKAGLGLQPRWMYVAWLMTRLIMDTSEKTLREWPLLASTLCERLTSPSAPHPNLLFYTSDAEWKTLAPVLSIPERLAAIPERLAAVDPRVTFTEFLNDKLGRRVDMGPGRSAQAKLVRYWMQGGHLGRALELLYKAAPRLESSQSEESQSELSISRLFEADAIVDLCRQTNPDLHQHLVLGFVKSRSQK